LKCSIEEQNLKITLLRRILAGGQVLKWRISQANPRKVLKTRWSVGKAEAGFKKIRRTKLTGRLAFCLFVTRWPFEPPGLSSKKGGDCFIPDERFPF
jgi:hypothetical protein